MDRRGEMRAADSDRQAVAEQLRTALSEGRLDLPEYDERVQRAYAAKTYADLDGLLNDLPGTASGDRARLAPVDPPAPVVSPSGSGYSAATRRWLLATWSSYISVVAITIGIWFVTGLAADGWPYFWPIWVAGPWGVILLVSTIGGLMGGAPRKWATRHDARMERRTRRRQGHGFYH